MRMSAVMIGCSFMGFLAGSALCTGPHISDADAQLALRVAAGLVISSRPGARVAHVVSTPDGGTIPRMSILEAVCLFRAAHGLAPNSASGTALSGASTVVQLTKAMVRNFTLTRSVRLCGHLLDPNGQPISGWITMEDLSGGKTTGTYADESGRFTMPFAASAFRPTVFSGYTASSDHLQPIFYTSVLPDVQKVGATGDTQLNLTRPTKPPTGFITGEILGGGHASERVGAWVRPGGGESGCGDGFATAGHYTLECPVGDAHMLIAKTGWDRGTSTSVTYTFPDSVKVETGKTVSHNIGFPALDTLTCIVQGGVRWPVRFLGLQPKETTGGYLCSSIQDPRPNGYALPVIPGRYTFSVDYERHEGTTTWRWGCVKDINVASGGGRVEIAMPTEPPNRTVTGIVRDSGGKPVIGAEITLARPQVEGNVYYAVAAITDSRGRYTVTAPEGSYSMYVRPRN